jgi:4-amino-4-deoxy-L-arabinose transferase-like glycosyltransferase
MKTLTENFLSKTKKNLPLILLFLFIAGLVIFAPIKETFEYNPDEGIDSIKASLFLKGFPLYKEIWSDQPPLFTVILAFWLKLFGASIYHGRILVLLFSGLLLWSFYQTIKLKEGLNCALIACIFLAFSSSFVRLSISIMIGLPCLSLAMLSIYFVTLYNKSYSGYLLALSAAFMALSLEIKFFSAFLIPVIMLELYLGARKNSNASKNGFQRLSASLFWLITATAVYFTITLIFFWPDLNLFTEQLFKPHLAKLGAPNKNLSIIYYMLAQDIDIALLALVGIAISLLQKNKQAIFPLLWFFLANIILFRRHPVWDHYYPLISIPACWLAAIGLSRLFDSRHLNSWLLKNNVFNFLSFALRCLTILGIFLSISALPLRYSAIQDELKPPEQSKERELSGLILKYKNKTRWMVTDSPVFAFNADMLAPPEIAVATIKRRFTGGATEDYFIKILKKYQPEQILLGRFKDYTLKITSYIENNYSRVHEGAFYRKSSPLIFYRTLLWKPTIWRYFRLPVLRTRYLTSVADYNKISLNLFIRDDLIEKMDKPAY